MRMQDKDIYFESKGFEVKRKYHSFDTNPDNGYYEFTIPHYGCNSRLSIKHVIFNDPATIVFWTDGTKTVVKCQDGDVFDPEKGLALAISKKALGNKGNYCNELKKWLPKEEEKSDVAELEFTLECDGAEILKNITKNTTTTKSITFKLIQMGKHLEENKNV